MFASNRNHLKLSKKDFLGRIWGLAEERELLRNQTAEQTVARNWNERSSLFRDLSQGRQKPADLGFCVTPVTSQIPGRERLMI